MISYIAAACRTEISAAVVESERHILPMSSMLQCFLCCQQCRVMCVCVARVYQDILVEEDSGADNELEDVLQSLHGLQQLLRQLLGIVHVVLQNFGQLPTKTVTQET